MAKAPVLITAPTEEPITVQRAKDSLGVLHEEDNALFSYLVPAARQKVEHDTRRALCTQTWDFYFDDFSDEPLVLGQNNPVSSITNVKYQNTSNTQTTLGTTVYELANYHGVGHVRLKYNQNWPSILDHEDSVVVRAVCGYGGSNAVPQMLKRAMELLIGHWYENREATTEANLKSTPMAYQSLIDPYRLPEIA